MRFIDKPLSELTPGLCEAELNRAKAVHARYANAVRAIKRVIEAKADLDDMGDGQEATEAADAGGDDG